MPNALRVGLLGPLQVRNGTGRPVHVGGRQLRVLLTLLALSAGRVAPAGSLAGQIWPGDPPCSLMRFESPLTGWNLRRSPT
jgi:DNA-binding SARP family transcriptional activator